MGYFVGNISTLGLLDVIFSQNDDPCLNVVDVSQRLLNFLSYYLRNINPICLSALPQHVYGLQFSSPTSRKLRFFSIRNSNVLSNKLGFAGLAWMCLIIGY